MPAMMDSLHYLWHFYRIIEQFNDIFSNKICKSIYFPRILASLESKLFFKAIFVFNIERKREREKIRIEYLEYFERLHTYFFSRVAWKELQRVIIKYTFVIRFIFNISLVCLEYIIWWFKYYYSRICKFATFYVNNRWSFRVYLFNLTKKCIRTNRELNACNAQIWKAWNENIYIVIIGNIETK